MAVSTRSALCAWKKYTVTSVTALKWCGTWSSMFTSRLRSRFSQGAAKHTIKRSRLPELRIKWYVALITVTSSLESNDIGQHCLRNRWRPKERLWSRPVPLRRKSYVQLAILCLDYTLHIGVGEDAASPRPSGGQHRMSVVPKTVAPRDAEGDATVFFRNVGNLDSDHAATGIGRLQSWRTNAGCRTRARYGQHCRNLAARNAIAERRKKLAGQNSTARQASCTP